MDPKTGFPGPLLGTKKDDQTGVPELGTQEIQFGVDFLGIPVRI